MLAPIFSLSLRYALFLSFFVRLYQHHTLRLCLLFLPVTCESLSRKDRLFYVTKTLNLNMVCLHFPLFTVDDLELFFLNDEVRENGKFKKYKMN